MQFKAYIKKTGRNARLVHEIEHEFSAGELFLEEGIVIELKSIVLDGSSIELITTGEDRYTIHADEGERIYLTLEGEDVLLEYEGDSWAIANYSEVLA